MTQAGCRNSRSDLLVLSTHASSERLFVEQLDDNVPFRWFAGLGLGDRAWNRSRFSKNRERFLDGQIAEGFFERVLPADF